jgi:hypothetical protein
MPQEHGSAIEPRHLRYFIAVAEMGSLTEAAERRPVAPGNGRRVRGNSEKGERRSDGCLPEPQ